MKKVVIINGPGKSGKGTFVCMCRLLLRKSKINVYNFSSIFPIKKKMVEGGIWDGKSEKTVEIRKKMVEIKESMTSNGDQPNHYLVNKIRNLDDNVIVFVQIREARNIQNFIDLCTKELRIVPDVLHLERHTESMDKFNSGVDLSSQTREFKNYDFEIDIRKDGFGHLKGVVEDFLSKVEPSVEIGDLKFEEVKNKELHKPFDDEMEFGVV